MPGICRRCWEVTPAWVCLRARVSRWESSTISNSPLQSETLRPGDTLVLYTDGISEAENDGGTEYGIERLSALIDQHCSGCPEHLIEACKKHLEQFRGNRERFDDETLLAIRFMPAAEVGRA